MTTSYDGTRLVTADMTLVVVLAMRGYKPIIELDPDDEKRARWVLSKEGKDRKLAGILNQYENGWTKVEPRHFMKTLRLVRRELYHLLEYKPEPLPR